MKLDLHDHTPYTIKRVRDILSKFFHWGCQGMKVVSYVDVICSGVKKCITKRIHIFECVRGCVCVFQNLESVSDGPCRECQCQDGHVICYQRSCPTCPVGTLTMPQQGQCCPECHPGEICVCLCICVCEDVCGVKQSTVDPQLANKVGHEKRPL